MGVILAGEDERIRGVDVQCVCVFVCVCVSCSGRVKGSQFLVSFTDTEDVKDYCCRFHVVTHDTEDGGDFQNKTGSQLK